MTLYAELKSVEAGDSLESPEEGFVKVVGPYSARKGLTYAAWREVGVSHGVLTKAGVQQDGT
jgi:hypothetical protein